MLGCVVVITFLNQTSGMSPAITIAARRVIEEVTREKTTHPNINSVGPRLHSHLHNLDRKSSQNLGEMAGADPFSHGFTRLHSSGCHTPKLFARRLQRRSLCKSNKQITGGATNSVGFGDQFNTLRL